MRRSRGGDAVSVSRRRGSWGLWGEGLVSNWFGNNGPVAFSGPLTLEAEVREDQRATGGIAEGGDGGAL